MFWKNFLKLCEGVGKSPTAITAELKISRGSITNWKNGSEPQPLTLKKIADYFGVTLEYLLREDDAQSETVELDPSSLYMIPLFENASAGFGAYASDQIDDYMPLYFANPAEATNTICIKVRGDSMYPKIEDGDIIQVHKQSDVASGDIAVVLLDGDQGLVKKVTFGTDWLELHSINPMYPPMHFDGASLARVRIVGLVTQVVKGINGRKANYIKKSRLTSERSKELYSILGEMSDAELRQFNADFNDFLRTKGGAKKS